MAFLGQEFEYGVILLRGKNENNVYKIYCLPTHPQSNHITVTPPSQPSTFT